MNIRRKDGVGRDLPVIVRIAEGSHVLRQFLVKSVVMFNKNICDYYKPSSNAKKNAHNALRVETPSMRCSCLSAWFRFRFYPVSVLFEFSQILGSFCPFTLCAEMDEPQHWFFFSILWLSSNAHGPLARFHSIAGLTSPAPVMTRGISVRPTNFNWVLKLHHNRYA